MTASEWESLAAGMPCDEDLLVDLGRVNWAAARLHFGVRDALNHLTGEPSDEPFKSTLGGAIKKLRKEAQQRAVDPSVLVEWAEDVGDPVVKRRNKVVHAVTITAEDGRQALTTDDHSAPGRFLRDDLIEVTGRLVRASQLLPRGPYPLKPESPPADPVVG